MKTNISLLLLAAALSAATVAAQDNSRPAITGSYAADIVVVSDAEEQALEQAKQALAAGGAASIKTALAIAIQEMEQAQAALEAAKQSPGKLDAAVAAEQAAYQALLKATPKEFRMSRSRSAGGGQGNSSGQPDQKESDQLDMPTEQNRYETERQAAAPQDAKQRERTQIADRLKELSQRQQDLNDRMRELQSALQSAHTDQERQDLQDQLKRLEDEQRQMLANVDEMRQQAEQSPNANSDDNLQKQLDQTRTDMQRASEALQNQSASQALAAGTRAQQNLRNARDDLRKQTSSQFSQQMRQMRNAARELTSRENEIAQGLDKLNQGAQSLDDSAQRRQISQRMAEQESALTNLLANMKEVTEQSETSEPLLSKQLYDAIRRADQARTDNLLDLGSQLVDRGFLPQAGEAERTARTNLADLAANVERAADSVLGSEADSLRYAQKQLDDLAAQLERELGPGTNADAAPAEGRAGAAGESNQVARAEGKSPAEEATRGRGKAAQSGEPASGENAPANSGETPSKNGGTARGQNAESRQTAENHPSGQSGRAGGNQTQTGGGADAAEQLRQIAERLGQGNPATNNGGPITGNDYAAWTDQLRDVESVLDSPDLRNQLATVRDRLGAYRGEYRLHRRIPAGDTVRRELLAPLSQVRVWVAEQLSREENSGSLVPLDRDPVPENYSRLVSKYYENLGSAP